MSGRNGHPCRGRMALLPSSSKEGMALAKLISDILGQPIQIGRPTSKNPWVASWLDYDDREAPISFFIEPDLARRDRWSLSVDQVDEEWFVGFVLLDRYEADATRYTVGVTSNRIRLVSSELLTPSIGGTK